MSERATATSLTREQVRIAYELIHRRPPENEAAFAWCLQHPNLRALGRSMMDSDEFRSRYPPRPDASQIFAGYVAADLALFRRFERYTGGGMPGFFTNWLGLRVSTDFYPATRSFDGFVEYFPEPTGSLQGTTSEWLSVIRAVLDAADRFVMLELGAAYGPWMAIAAAAARQRGIRDLRLVGVEGDATRVGFLRRHMRDNGIGPGAYEVLEGAVGPEAGTARWGTGTAAAFHYGARPLEDGLTDYAAIRHDGIVEVPMFAVDDLLRREPVWDLVHVDIQGSEAAVLRAGLPLLDERVRRVVVGTHSRLLDGEVMTMFHGAGWLLEAETPTVVNWQSPVEDLEAKTSCDGLQAWRNPRLSRAV